MENFKGAETPPAGPDMYIAAHANVPWKREYGYCTSSLSSSVTVRSSLAPDSLPSRPPPMAPSTSAVCSSPGVITLLTGRPRGHTIGNFHQIPCGFNGKRVGTLCNREPKGGRAAPLPLS
jgi:hypothetical protein